MSPNAYALDITRQALSLLLPEFLVLATAMVMITLGAFVALPRRVWSITAALSLLIALVVLFATRDLPTEIYASVALNDALGWYGRVAFALSGLVLLGLAHDQVDDARASDFFGALLVILAGAMLVAAANELVFLFVGLELVSIPTYLLLYLPRRTPTTLEAATKYFFLSVFASALFLFGLAYFYGLAGVSNMKALAKMTESFNGIPQAQIGLVAVLFVIAGLGFRVAAVPFHFYAPDVYQGSPTVVAALLAWIPKAVGFVAMVRVLTAVFGGDNEVSRKAMVLAWVIAAATMTLGNTVALLQDNLKRLLAYSSIAHAGYLMIGITVAFRNHGSHTDFLGTQGIFFYLITYALMTLGAFGVIIALDRPERPVETVDDMAGLGMTRPWSAFAMALCLFSLAGVPIMAGFWGKFYIFASALKMGDSALAIGESDEARWFWILAVIGVLNAAVGAYYYLRIVVVMYLRPSPDTGPRARIPWPTAAAFGTCAALSLLLGCFARPLARASREAALDAISRPHPIASAPAPIKG
ncbi:MAG TPA: NADH-quinone oxidoreductase subunit N [Isosphaeraceae bacterium]|nr:NADH-quinone oxidoreductase subunit N [Isosphaeraceae bacterium]